MKLEKISSNVRLMQGNSACAEAAIVAGLKLFAGYPITPSSEIAEILSRRLPQVGGKFIQMEDEIASMGVILGGSLAGAKTMTATSGPGFSLMQELIGFGCLCEIPCVIVNVQRGGPSTGLPTSPSQGDIMQARWGTHGDHPIIAIYPSSVEETYYLTIKAFNFAEKFRTPVILLSDEVIAHMRERIKLPHPENLEIINRRRPSGPKEKYLPYAAKQDTDIPPLANFGEGYRFNVTGLIHDETGFPTTERKKAEFLLKRLHNKIYSRIKEITIYSQFYCEDAEIIIVAVGSAARSSLEAVRILRERGKKIGLLKLNTIWPFPTHLINNLPSGVKKIVVVEMNLGQLIREVERCAGGRKVQGINIADGVLIEPSKIIEEISL